MLDSFKHLVGKKAKEDTQLKTYRSILEKNPKNVNIRLKLGDLYAKHGDKKAAVQEYTAAAIQYADDGYLVKAIAVNKLIVRLDSSRKEALDRLSDLYFQRGIVADPLVQDYRKIQQQAGPTAVQDEEIDIPTIDIHAPAPVSVSETEQPAARHAIDLAPYLPQVPLLFRCSAETRTALEKQGALRTFQPKESILSVESTPKVLWLILEGSANMYTKDKENQEVLYKAMGPGSFFGDTSLFTPLRQNQDALSASSFAVVAQTRCTLLEIPKSLLPGLAKRESEFSDALFAEQHQHKTFDFTLARVPLFSHLDPAEREKIAEQLSPAHAKQGTTIIREGEIGDSMYVIKSGQVGVYTTLMEDDGTSVIKTDQERLHLATLQDGDFFGEQALITHEPRSATIVALTDVQLFKFTKHDLELVIRHHPRVGTLLKKYNQQRISNTLKSLKSIW